MSRSTGEPKKEDVMTAVGAMLCIFLILAAVIWFTSSAKLVAFWTPKLYFLGKLWSWMPGAFASDEFEGVKATAQRFWMTPREVHFGEWLLFLNIAAWPFTALCSIGVAAFAARTLTMRQARVRRNLKPQELAERLSYVFTGTAPVLHLRKALAKDKEPFWRRPVFPHELLLKELVEGKPLVHLSPEGQRVMVWERARTYFMGLEKEKIIDEGGNVVIVDKRVNGRRISRTLGNQVVDLRTDPGKKGVVFADRFSPAGKVMFALLCAHAFGGDEGVKDYQKAKDQLNNSARGAAHGFANLTVAQWLFDKYRNNATARQLFAIHHWEYTYLFALFFQAKKQGKCPSSEFLWLKPMCRGLFFPLNTVMRQTPFVESAAVFAQYAFEHKLAKRKALPLKKVNGVFEHVIFIEKAVKGLNLEWERWRDGDDEDDDWWKSDEQWKLLSGARINLPPPPPPGLQGDTAFDVSTSIAAATRQAEIDAAMAAQVARERAAAEEAEPDYAE